jgi:hypothetical protein
MRRLADRYPAQAPRGISGDGSGSHCSRGPVRSAGDAIAYRSRKDLSGRPSTVSWDKPPTRQLVLDDWQTLVTLRDAARFFADRLDNRRGESPFESAIVLLLKAAISNNKRVDIEAATDQVTIVLSQRGMMR